MITVSQTRGQWLRDRRQARGWNIPEMRRQLREAATAAGDKLPGNDTLWAMIHRWENDRSGISERYRLHYCRAFQIPPGSFGKPAQASVPQANGSCPDDITRTGPATAILARLLPESPTAFPVQIPLGGGELRTAVHHLRDPADRDKLCFLLGYVSAIMAATRHGTSETTALKICNDMIPADAAGGENEP